MKKPTMRESAAHYNVSVGTIHKWETELQLVNKWFPDEAATTATEYRELKKRAKAMQQAEDEAKSPKPDPLLKHADALFENTVMLTQNMDDDDLERLLDKMADADPRFDRALRVCGDVATRRSLESGNW